MGATKLDRPDWQSIERRHEYLLNPPSKLNSTWTIEEDEVLLNVLFKVTNRDINNLDIMMSLKKGDFSEVSKELGRGTKACYLHWNHQLLPILKTDILKLPQGEEWRQTFLEYIVKNEIKSTKQ